MKTVQIREVVLGEGRPKVCVPVLGKTRGEIVQEAGKCRALHADVVEWRVDWFEHAPEHTQVAAVLADLREALGDTPLLFTFRTAQEGGEKSIDPAVYAGLNKAAIATGLVDLIDVELSAGDTLVRGLVEEAHRNGVRVVASSHDFEKTPPQEEIIARLRRMQELGADVPKIAVMPTCKADVLTLMAATLEMHEQYASGPVVTMSMGPLGVISRLSGEVFGSAMTFGAAGRASAPGQMPVGDLQAVLQALHASL